MTSRSKPDDYASAFGRVLDEQLAKRGMRQRELAEATQRSTSYLNQTMTGRKPASVRWADLIADALRASEEERRDLHRGIAADLGLKIDLTKP